MFSTGDYPLGAAHDSRAPYNQIDNPEVEIEVYVWKTIGKKMKIKVSDYTITSKGVDEDGPWCERDYSSCDLWSKVEDTGIPDGWEELERDITIEKCS